LHAAEVASRAGVQVTPLSFFRFSNPAPDRRALLLGYAGLTPEQIMSGAERLARALEPITLRPSSSSRGTE
jgi:DNA-binding transcriptional MocR family regulator